MRERWDDLMGVWAVDRIQAGQKFAEVCGLYTDPGRHYHTLEHVKEVVSMVEHLGAHTLQLNAVCLAAWLHDVVYDSKASDNEERSAHYAERLCLELGIPEGPRVADLIRKTKTHKAGEDVDAQVLLDADLAILGASESVYRVYAQQIRQEYGWVPEPAYRQGRRQVIQSFLTRPRIYYFLSRLENSARRNLAAEIALLA
jgi:predicted metal-dependent HD superfamily phosphohydrolase